MSHELRDTSNGTGFDPLGNANRRLDQLRAGDAGVNSSVRLLGVLLDGRRPKTRVEPPQTDDEKTLLQAREHQFDSALMGVYGEIILAATKRFGSEFVSRAAIGELTSEELSGTYCPEEESLHEIAFNAGGARG